MVTGNKASFGSHTYTQLFLILISNNSELKTICLLVGSNIKLRTVDRNSHIEIFGIEKIAKFISNYILHFIFCY